MDAGLVLLMSISNSGLKSTTVPLMSNYLAVPIRKLLYVQVSSRINFIISIKYVHFNNNSLYI